MFSRCIFNCVRLIFNSTSRNVGTFKQVNTKKNLLCTVLEGARIQSADDWLKVREEILHEKTHITNQNIDAMMLGFYTNSENYDMAMKFVDFLKSQNIKMNLATIGKYFRLFYLVNNKKNIGAEAEKELVHMYEEIRKIYPVLDSITLDNLIEGLSITSQWRICLDLIKEIKITATPVASTYNCIASALFTNGEEDLGWTILQEMLENARNPKPSTFSAYLNFINKNCKDKKEQIIKIEKLFTFLQENDLKCDMEFADDLSKFLQNNSYTHEFTSVTNRGNCASCKKNLIKLGITENEFHDLKTTIIKNVIIGRDVFNKSTPSELKRFTDFMGKNQRYDVVIDGLNVAYSAGTKQSPKVHSFLISAVINHFLMQNKKVLLLGRQHMSKWPRFKSLTQDVDVFLTSDVSHDDPYLLYCALNSGQDIIIVSRDLMRGHKFLLKQPKLKMLFNRWLSERLYRLQFVDKNGKVTFVMPPQFTVSCQKIENCWHIPFSMEENSNQKTQGVDASWLCVEL